MNITLPPKSDAYPEPAHVASFETFTAGLNTFLGADFSRQIDGSLHLNAASILARDIAFTEHTLGEASQVARDICTYTAERVAQGRATVLARPLAFIVKDGVDEAAATEGITVEDLDLRAGPNWQSIRPYIAHRLVEDLQSYRDAHVDSTSTTSKRIIDNIDSWLPVVTAVAHETTQDIIVTDSPQLLPGVEVIALANASSDDEHQGKQFREQLPKPNPYD